MLSMQQMEELEGRILKALELITDLRSENARLEADNEKIRAENEEIKLKFEEKDREISKLKIEWRDATSELEKLKEKEELLEKKVVEMLTRLESIKSGTIPAGDTSPVKTKKTPRETDKIEEKPAVSAKPETMEEQALGEEEILIEDEDEIILLDEDTDFDSEESQVLDEEEKPEPAEDSADTDEEIVLEDDDELDVIDEDNDFIVVEEDSKEKVK